MFWNAVTGSVIGAVVAGLAFAITKQHHPLASPPAVRAAEASSPETRP
jgi:hypothetical protein